MIDPELQLLLAQPARQTEARSRSRSPSRSRDVIDAARRTPHGELDTLAAPTNARIRIPIGDPVVIVHAGDCGPAAPMPRLVRQSWCAPVRWPSRADCACAAYCRTASRALPVLEMTPQERPLWLPSVVLSRHQQLLA